MSNCPFTGYREIEKVAKNAEAFSTRHGLNHLHHPKRVFQQLSLRHAWPLLKNSKVIFKALRANKKGIHGRFSELPPAESLRYRNPINSFIQKRTWDDLRLIIEKHLENIKNKNNVCLSQDLVWPCNEEATLRLLGIRMEDWKNYKQPLYDFIFDLQEDSLLALIDRIRARSLLEKEIARQRKNPETNGLIEHLINYERKGERFSDTEIAGSVWMMLGGHTSTRYFLSNALNFFAKDEGARREFQTNPKMRTPIIDELLRFFTPGFQSQRLVTQDFCVGEKKLKKGDVATLRWVSGNFDEDVFENAGEINFSRNAKDHLSFGIGARYCLGAGFARNFIELFLLRFFEEFPSYRINFGLSVKLKDSTFDGFEKLPVDLRSPGN